MLVQVIPEDAVSLSVFAFGIGLDGFVVEVVLCFYVIKAIYCVLYHNCVGFFIFRG